MEEEEEKEEQEEEEKEDEKRMMEEEKRKGKKGEKEGECRENVLSESLAPSNQGDHIKDLF